MPEDLPRYLIRSLVAPLLFAALPALLVALTAATLSSETLRPELESFEREELPLSQVDRLLMVPFAPFDDKSSNQLRRQSDFFLLGVISFLALMQFFFFSLRRSEKSPLYLALFALTALVLITLQGFWFYELLPKSELLYAVFQRLLFIAMIAAFLSMALFFYHFYRDCFPEKSAQWMMIASGTMALYVLVVPVAILWYILVPYAVVAGLFLGSSIVFFFQQAWQHQRRGYVTLFALFSFAAGLLIDLWLTTQKQQPSFNYSAIGAVAFLISHNLIISVINARARNTAEYLSQNLHVEVEKKTKELHNRQQEMQRDLQLASIVQDSLLPPRIILKEGLSIVSSYTPLDELGGDIFDVLFFDDGRVAIFIADVKGHGLAASLIAVMVKAFFLNRARPSRNCGDTISSLNRELSRILELGDYVTAFYAIIDHKEKSLRYARAGHVPPVLQRRSGDGSFEELFADGPVMGLDEHALYPEERLHVDSGDRLFLFTDGMLEEKNNLGEEYGEERFLSSLENNSKREVLDALQAILVDLDLFKGGAPSTDDLTLLTIELH